MIWCCVSEMIRLAITGLARDAVGLPGQTVTSGDMVKVGSITSQGLSYVTCVTSQAMARYIWPADEPGVRRRVVASLGVLVAAKLLNTAVPFILAAAVDGNYITACHVSRVTCHVSRARPQHGPARPRHPRLHRHHPRHGHAARLRGRQGGGARPQ